VCNHRVWTWFAPIHPSWSPRSTQCTNSNTNAIPFIIVRVVLQLLTPVVVHSRHRIVVVLSFPCCRNCHLGPKPNHRRRLCRSVSPVEPPLSVAAKSPLSSRVTRHSHRSRAMPNSPLHFANLNESNYAEWSLYMRSTLIKKGLWKVVEGSETRPLGSPNSKAVKAFEHCQAEAHVLCLKLSQLPHAHSTDPHVLWEELQRMHRAQGFATCMTFCRRFNMMTKRADQSMGSWIADVQQATFRLKEVGYIATDEDKILVLTQGLPPSYDPFIISLDAAIANGNTADNASISLEVVKARLLNEESRQRAAHLVTSPDSVALAVTTIGSKPCHPLEQITCFHCGEKGHYQINCPKWKVEEKGTAAAIFEEAEQSW